MKIAVVGLGKIGLPLAVQYASMGHQVSGIDISSSTVDSVNAGIEPFPGEFQLQSSLRLAVNEGRLVATTSYETGLSGAEVVVVVVPVFLDESGESPDFSSMDAASAMIGQNLNEGMLVIYETTLPVGTTRNRLIPLLESKSELFEGDDFHVIFSPERVLTGRVFQDLRRYPKLVGATNSKGFKLGKTFYDSVIQFDERSDLKFQNGVWDLGSLEAAEFAKLAETTYRDVNIALANQFAQFADTVGADIGRVIEACNSQPFSNIHKPGISVGGHCIPVYPRLYLHNDKDAHLVETARLKNLEMPGWVADKVNDAVRPLAEKKILILGATYRGGVKETAYSGVFALRDSLKQYCANVFVSDPMLTAEELTTRGLRTDFTNDQIDVIILHTDHEEYKNLTSDHFPNCFWIFDGRGTLNPSQFPNSVYWSIMGRDFDNIH